MALPGTTPDNDHWVRRKTAVVYRFHRSSFYMGVSCRMKGIGLAERFTLDREDYAAHGGSFPIRVRGVGLVGTVTVSGLPQEEDHRLVVATLDHFLAGAEPVGEEARQGAGRRHPRRSGAVGHAGFRHTARRGRER